MSDSARGVPPTVLVALAHLARGETYSAEPWVAPSDIPKTADDPDAMVRVFVASSDGSRQSFFVRRGDVRWPLTFTIRDVPCVDGSADEPERSDIP